jgi:uncharacterized membrane protein YgcG
LITDSDGDGTTGDHGDWVNASITYTGLLPTTSSTPPPPVELQYVDSDWIKAADTSVAVSYSGTWTAVTGVASDSPTLHSTKTKGDTANFAFVGDYVRFYGSQRTDLAQARIWLDGVVQKIVSETATTTDYDVVLFESSALDYGSHTLTVESFAPPIQVDGFAYRTPATPWDNQRLDGGAMGSGGGGGGGSTGGAGGGGGGASSPLSTTSGSGAASSPSKKGGCQVGSGTDSAWSAVPLGAVLVLLRARGVWRQRKRA